VADGVKPHLDDLHVLAVSYWHSIRPSSDQAFIGIVDQIEARSTPESFDAWKQAFPDARGILQPRPEETR